MQTIVWRDGKTRITTDNAYLEISNRVQVRFTEEFPDEQHAAARYAPKRATFAASWRIRRAKFKLEGWMIRPWLTYELQLNWPALTSAATNVGALLEDAMFDVDLSKGRGTVPGRTSASSRRRTARSR